MSEPFKIQTIHEFIATDDDWVEGVVAFNIRGKWFPVVHNCCCRSSSSGITPSRGRCNRANEPETTHARAILNENRFGGVELKNPIRIWTFEDAPVEFRELCDPDDADYLAEVPEEYLGENLPSFLEYGGSFGRCQIDQYQHPYKKTCRILVGYHA